MSNLQNDKDVIREGRKNTLKEAEVPLRDRIVKSLMTKLEEDDVGTKLNDAWYMATADIQSALDTQQTLLADLDDFATSGGNNKHGGVSNIHLPVAFIIVKTYHARFLDAILGIDPPFSAKARREDGVDKVAVVEDLMRYNLSTWCNNFHGIDDSLDDFIWDWCASGTAIMKTRWKTEYESYVDIVVESVPTPPLMQEAPDGTIVSIPQYEEKEKEATITKRTFNGIQYDVVSIEDFRMIGGKGDPDLADKVAHSQWYTASELWTAVDQKRFKREAVEKLIEGGQQFEAAGVGAGIKQQRDIKAGSNSYDGGNSLDRYQIIEWCFKYDTNGSGINSDLVAWVSLQTGDVLGCTYLRRISPTGERPYSVAYFHKRKGESHGIGLGEILLPLTREIDAMHNIRIDNAIFQSIPFFFYRASSGMDAAKLQVEPGMGIPLDNPQTDVFFPNVGNRTSFTANEEQVIQGYVERLTGISDLSLGVQSGQQGATRTASGVRALLGENNNNLSVHLRRLNKAWSKILRTSFHLLQNRCEPDFQFRITGENGQDVFRKIFDQDLALEVDFELSANTANTNKSVQMETAQILVQTTMNPLNIQMGLSGPNEMYASQKNYLSTIGVKDIHRYLKKPADYGYVMSPEEEFQRVIREQKVDVQPNSDHKGFIAFAMSMLEQQDATPNSRTLTHDQELLIIDQVKKHQAMDAAMDQQAAQQNVANQMQQNAIMSQQQAPTGLNALTGADPSELFTTSV